MDWRARASGLRIGGHRGDPESAPENTFAAFEAAVVAGVVVRPHTRKTGACGDPGKACSPRYRVQQFWN